jgi:hypothetical protein
MILPNIRASFTRGDALHLVELVGGPDDELRTAARERLERDGVDALLDDPRVANALLTGARVTAPPRLVFYVLVRQALLEAGVDEVGVADFVASLVVAFGQARRAWRVSETEEDEYVYLVDLLQSLRGADSRRSFLLRSHLGNYSLWLAGLFPDWVEHRSRRRGGPSLRYYERMGAGGYAAAARSPEARSLKVDALLADVGRDFSRVRSALNRVSERHLWPDQGDPTDRLLRAMERGGA